MILSFTIRGFSCLIIYCTVWFSALEAMRGYLKTCNLSVLYQIVSDILFLCVKFVSLYSWCVPNLSMLYLAITTKHLDEQHLQRET